MPKEIKDFLLRAVSLMLRAYQDVLRVPSQQSVLSHPGWITSLELFTPKGLEAIQLLPPASDPIMAGLTSDSEALEWEH